MTPKYESREAYRRAIFDQKSESILHAAFTVFCRDGYRKASVGKIAAEGGISQTTIYKHYADKKALFSGVMSTMWEQSTQSIEDISQTEDVREGLISVGNQYAQLLLQPDVRSLFKVIIAEVDEFPELGHLLYTKGKRPYLDALHTFVASKNNDQTLAVDNITIASSQFLGMINDIVFWPTFLVPSLPEYSDDEVAAIVAEAVETFCSRYESH